VDNETKLWLEILTSGKVVIEPDQARAILWLAIWNAAQALLGARSAAPVVAPVAAATPKPAKPGLAKTKPAKPAGRPTSAKSVESQVLAAIKAGATSYEALRKSCPKVDPKRLYRACDQLVQRNQIARTRGPKGVTLAAR
jgi:hypothetical protein